MVKLTVKQEQYLNRVNLRNRNYFLNQSTVSPADDDVEHVPYIRTVRTVRIAQYRLTQGKDWDCARYIILTADIICEYKVQGPMWQIVTTVFDHKLSVLTVRYTVVFLLHCF